jgi:uncharacterized protein (DUF302 family)
MAYALSITIDLPFDEAVAATRDALSTSGFGVVSDIDMHATFGAKLGESAAAELGEYRILGACNPRLAQKALASEPDVGLLLPCNVVVRRAPHATSTTVQAIDAMVISDLSGHTAVTEVASEATALLRAALGAVAAGAGAKPPNLGLSDAGPG